MQLCCKIVIFGACYRINRYSLWTMDTRYKIFEELHPSGSHLVLKAYDRLHHHFVSIRQIFTSEEVDSVTEEQMTSFKDEALRLLNLNHPSINMFNAIMHDEYGICLITDMQEGATLNSLVKKGPVNLRDFLQIALTILGTIDYIHQHGVLHRSLNPDNIQINRAEDGHFDVVLLEVAYEHIADVNQESEMRRRFDQGAVMYMAPEQLVLRGELSVATDLYALGCIFYYCLSGQHAFHGINAMDKAKRHLKHEVVHLQELRTKLPFMLCEWVMWLMQANPQQRPASAREALSVLSTMRVDKVVNSSVRKQGACLV